MSVYCHIFVIYQATIAIQLIELELGKSHFYFTVSLTKCFELLKDKHKNGINALAVTSRYWKKKRKWWWYLTCSSTVQPTYMLATCFEWWLKHKTVSTSSHNKSFFRGFLGLNIRHRVKSLDMRRRFMLCQPLIRRERILFSWFRHLNNASLCKYSGHVQWGEDPEAEMEGVHIPSGNAGLLFVMEIYCVVLLL